MRSQKIKRRRRRREEEDEEKGLRILVVVPEAAVGALLDLGLAPLMLGAHGGHGLGPLVPRHAVNLFSRSGFPTDQVLSFLGP